MKNNGYLYVVDGLRWVREVSYAATRLRSLSDYPIAIICSEEYTEIENLVDSLGDIIIKIIPRLKGSNFCSKVIGMQNSPFENSLFMDSDTYVLYNIDKVFELLKLYDIALTQESSEHTSLFPIKDNLENILIEYNTGVVLFKKNEIVMKFLREWEEIINSKLFGEDYFDMPQFRNIVIHSKSRPVIYTLSENYNIHGLRSYKILNGKVAIIHERFGTYWNSYSEKMLNNNRMGKIAKRINKFPGKRIFIPFFNIVLSTNKISITYLIRRMKIKLGFPKIPKKMAF